MSEGKGTVLLALSVTPSGKKRALLTTAAQKKRGARIEKDERHHEQRGGDEMGHLLEKKSHSS